LHNWNGTFDSCGGASPPRRGFFYSYSVDCPESRPPGPAARARPMRKKKLTVKLLCLGAAGFARGGSADSEATLYGVTDGKAIGTYLEHKFRAHLEAKYTFAPFSSAAGIDFPDLQVDMKVTAVTQPQSSCPFKSGRQKIFGLGYAVLVFVYEKKDD